MKLKRLDISGVRNVRTANFNQLADVNLIWGENGAGKTSILEALSFLSLGRSFRTNKSSTLINDHAEEMTVFGESDSSSQLGITRNRAGKVRIRINGEDESQLIKLSGYLPLLVIDSETFLLVNGGPKARRQFIDWGLFHVKQSEFYTCWQKFQRALKQRNELLKNQASPAELSTWTRQFVEEAERLDILRRGYVGQVQVFLKQALQELTDGGLTISANYFSGWKEGVSFTEVLENNIERDRQRGLTLLGPHKADIRLIVSTGESEGESAYHAEAKDILSRGQKKLLVSALRIAQCRHLQSTTGVEPIMLIDDLPSEVDLHHQQRLCELIDKLELQTFITCIDPAALLNFAWCSAAKSYEGEKQRTLASFEIQKGQLVG